MELIFIDSEPKSKFGGGIRTYLNLCLALCEKYNIKTTLYTHNQSGYPSKYKPKRIQRLRLPYPFVRKILYKTVYSAVVALEYSYWLKKELLNETPSKRLVEFCDFGGYAYYSLKDKQLRPNIVIRIHTPGFIIPLRNTHGAGSRIIFGMEKYCLKKSTTLTTPSKIFVEQNLAMVKNYVYLRNPFPASVIRFQKKVDLSVLRLIYVGRIEERKGVYILLKALEKLSNLNIVLTLVGSGLNTTYGQKIKSLSSLISHKKFKIQFVTESSKESLAQLCKENQFAIFPSLFENSPYAYMEQLGRNLIPLGTSTGEMQIIQRELNYPSIIPNDIHSLSEAIKKIYSDCKNDPNVFFKYLENQHAWLIKNKPDIDKKWVQFYRNALAI